MEEVRAVLGPGLGDWESLAGKGRIGMKMEAGAAQQTVWWPKLAVLEERSTLLLVRTLGLVQLAITCDSCCT